MNRALLLVMVLGTLGGVALTAARPAAPDLVQLAPASALGVTVDTLLLGGYTGGTFAEAVEGIGGALPLEERALVARHLERIFEAAGGEGIGRTGRLRVAYERALRPDGSARSVRVLAAELALGGRVHTAFYFERNGAPGYYDPFGRPLAPDAWSGPLATMRVTSAFGARRMHPILMRELPHSGVDLRAPAGEPVRAPSDGVVAVAGTRGGYGLLVELQHPDGYTTRYAHLERIASGVEPARVVRRGEIIGFVGMSGLATGPHLHFEIRRRGQALDPMGITATSALVGSVGDEREWAAGRSDLAALLARTPTQNRAQP